jgi:hypothetical protein
MDLPYELLWCMVESEYAATINNAWVIDDRGLVAPKFDSDSYDGHGHFVWAHTTRRPKGFIHTSPKKPRSFFHGIEIDWVISLSSALPVENDEVPIDFVKEVLNYVHEWALRATAIEHSSPIQVDQALGANTWKALSRTLDAAEAGKDVEEDQRTVVPDWPPNAAYTVVCRAGLWREEKWMRVTNIYSTVPVDRNGRVIKRDRDFFSCSAPFPILTRLMDECARDKRLHHSFWAVFEEMLYGTSELTSPVEFRLQPPSVIRERPGRSLLEWPATVLYCRSKHYVPRAVRPGYLRYRPLFCYVTSTSWDMFVSSLVLSMVAVCRRIRSTLHELPPDTRDTESLLPPFDYNMLKATPLLRRFGGAVCAGRGLRRQ